LGCLDLSWCPLVTWIFWFNLSHVLWVWGATALQDLTLSFQGEDLWLRPEGKQLCSVFSGLRKMSLLDIFMEFDLPWMMVLLEAAPSRDVCYVYRGKKQAGLWWKNNPSWKVVEFANREEWQLKEFQVTGVSPIEQQLTLIKWLWSSVLPTYELLF
jgi:hypothetical protein